MYFAVAANEGFKLMSVDIRAAFLQAKCLDREVYMKSPKDVKKEGKMERFGSLRNLSIDWMMHQENSI